MNNPFSNVVETDADVEQSNSTHWVIDSFKGENEYLSNFLMRPFTAKLKIVNDNGDLESVIDTFQSIEHAFQASKVLDRDVQYVIRDAGTPGKAKKLGRKAKLRKDWEEVKLDIMYELVKAKFDQHLDLKMHLLATGDAELVEGNTWRDGFWGVKEDGVGENHLGKILMRVRQEFRDQDGDFETVFKSFLTDHNLDFIFSNIKFDWSDHG